MLGREVNCAVGVALDEAGEACTVTARACVPAPAVRGRSADVEGDGLYA